MRTHRVTCSGYSPRHDTWDDDLRAEPGEDAAADRPRPGRRVAAGQPEGPGQRRERLRGHPARAGRLHPRRPAGGTNLMRWHSQHLVLLLVVLFVIGGRARRCWYVTGNDWMRRSERWSAHVNVFVRGC